MATITQVRERVQILRDQIERMKVLGEDIFPDAVTQSYIMEQIDSLGDIVSAACVPNTGIFLGIFNTACPSGWENVTALNDTFPMGGATYGTAGGASSHTHSYDSIGSHTHGTDMVIGNDSSSHSHSYTKDGAQATVSGVGVALRYAGTTSGTTGSGGGHTHTVAGSTGSSGEASQTSAAGGTLPPYIDVVICKAVP